MPDESQQGAQQLDASYPAPPDYFALFTDENIARLQSTNQDTLSDRGAADPWLDPQKIPQLLNHSVVFEFLDLVDRIRDIFVNIHHLINEYRGHQAKESLKLMLRQQIESKRTPLPILPPPPLPNDDATTTAKDTSSLAAVPSSPDSHTHVATLA
ncbi:hypothetical protein BX661DRAFT_200818 [Kickxella alabastrina]|uniref:uncharacterized protein n=1 Tax=Kickxella alabastrina TaxID=61397 RepID=UPI0022203532|nr:uncharacterized protein BX661DRAFT_200818 [Kickxella alabastrina]KAI7821134.1 hypothetical protein BX661DRAFT_200818 [Kickxella alabastrina]